MFSRPNKIETTATTIQWGNLDNYFVLKFKIHLFKWYFCGGASCGASKKIEQYHIERRVWRLSLEIDSDRPESSRSKMNNNSIS